MVTDGRLPDFIIIGAMKCATSTLHDQLDAQSGIFMSTPKEPNFFSDDDQWQRGITWYRSLFAAANGDQICGESSTHYTKIPTYPKTVERISRSLSDVRYIYVMRHPMDRLISQYIHEWTEKKINLSIDDAVDKYPRLVNYSLYSTQLEPYIKEFGYERVLPVFFERLVTNPGDELRRICDFIGYHGELLWQREQDKRNVSSERLRESKIRDALVWNPVSSWIRHKFIPQRFRDRVKRLWQTTERPRLSDVKSVALEQTFNNDLTVLGYWLGAKLTCENFKSITSTSVLDWDIH